MFRKRIGDQSESKIGSDKIPAKKDQARFAGPLRWAVGLNALWNIVDFLVLLTENLNLLVESLHFVSFRMQANILCFM